MEQRAAGTWPSPVTAASSVGGSVGISEVVPDGDDVWWAEQRPDEGGRTALVRWRPSNVGHHGGAEGTDAGETVEVTPADANVRTSVHEYGGGAWWIDDGVAYYAEFADQRLRRLEVGGRPLLLTPEPETPRALRYADGRVTPDGMWFVCVRERHHRSGVANELVAVATDGSMTVRVLAEGADFYAAPRVSPDGGTLAWIQWEHPNMPWDTTELWIGGLNEGRLVGSRCLVGNGDEALQQPEWMRDGRLCVVSDRTEWWNLYAVDVGDGTLAPIAVGDYEIVEPHWVFGGSRYADGVHVIGGATGDTLSTGAALPYTTIGSVRRSGDGVTFVGASYAADAEVARLRGVGADAQLDVLRPAHDVDLDRAFLPDPEFITFPTTGGAVAHGLYYAPAHPDYRCLRWERPPLLVFIHGGPTSAARRQFSAKAGHRFWTSRGIAVVDVDYRGSTRYGRNYRQLLRERWCVLDVDDAVAAAAYLAARGDVDADRMAIRGGSAGGTTTLMALAEHDTFAAGACRYGVADMVALLADDHKFESRYTVQLIGPWPAERDRYAARSPINHATEITVPLLVMQGSDDTVVPPRHSEMIVEALEGNGVPVAYLVFDGEGHGFRRAESIVRAQEAELYFYGKVLGFEPADDVAPVPVSGGGGAFGSS